MSQAAFWWVPLLSATIGGLLVLIGGYLTQWLISKREREVRWKEFQRSTLIDLQADLLQIYRGVERKENYTQAWRRSTILVVRIEDDRVRKQVDDFKVAVTGANEEGMRKLFESANARIGEILRAR